MDYRLEAPEPREDGFFECGNGCGFSKYYNYAEDAPEFCPDCESLMVEGDMGDYEEGLAADAADVAHDRMREDMF